MNGDFNPQGFDWKKAIWEMHGKMAGVEGKIDNHLRHHERWDKWALGVAGGSITGILVWLFRGYFFRQP